MTYVYITVFILFYFVASSAALIFAYKKGYEKARNEFLINNIRNIKFRCNSHKE